MRSTLNVEVPDIPYLSSTPAVNCKIRRFIVCVAVELAFTAPFKPHHFSHTSYISLMKIIIFKFLYSFASLEMPGIMFLLQHLSYDTISCADRPKYGINLS